MSKYVVILLLLCSLSPLMALLIVDAKGEIHEYPYEHFFRLQGEDFETTKEVDKEIVTNTWKGIRFDRWLKEQKLGDFARISFKSGDRYEVNFNRAEWDTLTCYLAYSGEGKIFPKEQLRIIFPHLRSMHWVRDVIQVTLDNAKQIPMPVRFLNWNKFFIDRELVKDPKPFKKIEGYPLDDFVGELSDAQVKDVVLYSSDGLIQNLSYPSQLGGAVLERDPNGKMNLKSPQIPGGMWMKDVVYLQVDQLAIISPNSPSALIHLAKTLNWQITPESTVRLHYTDGAEEDMILGDALAEPMVFDGTGYFSIQP